jgi:hypothetical protein
MRMLCRYQTTGGEGAVRGTEVLITLTLSTSLDGTRLIPEPPALLLCLIGLDAMLRAGYRKAE